MFNKDEMIQGQDRVDFRTSHLN